MNKAKQKDISQLALIVLVIGLLNFFVATSYFRIDLTEDQRFSLGEPTKLLVDDLEDDVVVQVFLSGDLPNKYKKVEQTIKDKLNDLNYHSNTYIEYEFIDPLKTYVDTTDILYSKYLKNIGVQELIDTEFDEGNAQSMVIFPVAIVSYQGRKTLASFVDRNIPNGSPQAVAYYQSQVEYELANAINCLLYTSPSPRDA